MSMKTVQEIANNALSLNARERADIAQILIQSLESSQDHEEEWLNLARQRRDELASGEVSPVEWSEIKAFATEE